MKKYKCKICGYIIETEELSDDYVCPICGVNKSHFELIEEEPTDSNILKEDIEAVIDSIVESTTVEHKIINKNIEDKRIKISDYNYSIMRIEEKCINCGQCRKTCEEIQNISYDLNICKEPICVGCGQCILNCPTGALVPKYVYREVKDIISSNEKIVIALTSPAVRVSVGDLFDNEFGADVEKKLVGALKKLGFDYVFDTAFGADLTIMEEVAELIDRIKEKKTLPQFTSCCPAWVKYAEIYHPELIDNISTCKSPIGMQCAIIKNYFAEKRGIDPSKIVTVAITPCTSKKMEAREYVDNIDYVVTANELTLFLKEEDINLNHVTEKEYDKILGESSGAGVLFGATGGVMEAAMRTLHKVLTGHKPKDDFMKLEELRGYDGIKTSTIELGNNKIKVAIVNGINNLELILKDDLYKKFHFIEVMNCKGGCTGGGGQPLSKINEINDINKKRIEGLYKIDSKRTKRCSYENEEIKQLYKEYLNNPLSDKSERLLHTSFNDKSSLLKGNL